MAHTSFLFYVEKHFNETLIPAPLNDIVLKVAAPPHVLKVLVLDEQFEIEVRHHD